MNRGKALLTLGLFSGTLSISMIARAFPDMIRHHYVNCNACHASPTGGGMLNSYGQQMSKELLSTWGSETEHLPLHGLGQTVGAEPSSFLIGGDVRLIQTYRNSPERISARGFLMQAGLEIGASVGSLTAVINVGHAQAANNSVSGESSKYYLIYGIGETVAVMAGRFIPQFGLLTAYHTLPTRSGFGPDSEKDTLQIVGSDEKWGYSMAYARSKTNISSANRESQMIGHVHLNLRDSYRLGFSAHETRTATQSRQSASLHAILGFSDNWSYLTDFVWTRTEGVPGLSLSEMSIVDWEMTRGLHLYLMQDYQRQTVADDSLSDSYGLGVRFYPRPHFEFDSVFRKKRTVVVADRFDDEAWLLAHYYF